MGDSKYLGGCDLATKDLNLVDTPCCGSCCSEQDYVDEYGGFSPFSEVEIEKEGYYDLCCIHSKLAREKTNQQYDWEKQ